MKMRDTTRLAFQSAVAVLVAEALGQILPVDKSYWVTLTAMALSVQTWGESLKKAIERVTMTIIGGTVGTLIYFLLPPGVTLLFIMLLIFVFLAVYLIQINHQLGVFFISAFVVFLFALLSQWNLSLLGYRIVDTLIGAIIALTVSYFFIRKSVSPNNLLIHFWEKLLDLLEYLAENQNKKSLSFSTKDLYADYIEMRNQILSARYQMFFEGYNRRQFMALLNLTGQITQNINLFASTQYWDGQKMDKKERESIKASLLFTINQTKQAMHSITTNGPSDFKSTKSLLNEVVSVIRKEPKRFLVYDEEGFTFYRMMYYLYRVNIRVAEAGSVVSEKK